MGNLIVNSQVVYLEPWQVMAALNTAPNYWPPRPIKAGRPYMFKLYLPLEGVGGTGSLDSDYLSRVHGFPAQGAVLTGLEALKPGGNGAILYAFDSAPVKRGPGLVDPSSPGAWAHYFGEEPEILTPTWAGRFTFELVRIEATRITRLTDGEAVPMGLIGIHTYTRGAGIPMIKDAWNKGMLIEDLYYDRAPVVVGYTLKRIA